MGSWSIVSIVHTTIQLFSNEVVAGFCFLLLWNVFSVFCNSGFYIGIFYTIRHNVHCVCCIDTIRYRLYGIPLRLLERVDCWCKEAKRIHSHIDVIGISNRTNAMNSGLRKAYVQCLLKMLNCIETQINMLDKSITATQPQNVH